MDQLIRGYIYTFDCDSKTMFSHSVLLLTLIHCEIIFFFCSDTGVISVQSATYGRTSSQICSFGRPQSQISNTWCSINVPVIYKRCDGLRTCGLNTQGLSTPDPCFGTYKYYTTNYICIPAETSVTCHGGYGYLKCKNGKIQINAANYGRTDKITCSHGRPSEQLQNTNCYSPNALINKCSSSRICNGLENCEVYATHMIFTDPCFGTYKYLVHFSIFFKRVLIVVIIYFKIMYWELNVMFKDI
uniref:L-rhamnose-binding lectin CSL3-like n=1 Tax=Sinocyclocheilus grahami TaxID=75366 RepID=A0A672MZL8_SINGR